MIRKRIAFISVCLVFLVGCQPAVETAAPEQELQGIREDLELIWSDEFNGEELDPGNWSYDLGGGGWGNYELQTYTNHKENVRVENGTLVIEAHKSENGHRAFTSGRIKTEELQTFVYGRIEGRMKLPTGKGIWSAFWMLGDDYATAVWPNSGEIDIMENIGVNNHIHGKLHGPGYYGGGGIGGSYMAGDFDPGEFHVYAVEWTPDEIRWYVDDENFTTVRAEYVPGTWVFDHPFFIILNIAVGGDWPGAPDDTTEFPQRMVVDYIRVYRFPDDGIALPEVGSEMHIEEVNLEILASDGSRQGQIYVKVVDQNGSPVTGARVTGGWLGVVKEGDSSAVTNDQGIAGPLLSETTQKEGEISFCVTAVTGGGYSYSKADNVKNCAFFDP